MRVQLSRERNNVFKIPDSFIRKTMIRIMTVYENNSILSSDEYKFMGPRQIKVLRHVNSDSKVYAKVTEIKKGNQLIPK